MVIKTLKDLSVPEESGCIFTKPDFKNWPSLLCANRDSLATIDNRNTSRSELVNVATEYTYRTTFFVPHSKGKADIVVTGHQPNWHHCGIFAKNIITDRFAGQVNGISVQLVLDHDVCNTSLLLPGCDNNGLLWFKTILLERKQQNMPLELRQVPSNEQLGRFIDSVLKNSKDSFCYEIWYQNLHCILENAQSRRSTADLIIQLQALLNEAFGLEIIYLPVSLMSETGSFTGFVYSVISDAVSFVRVYNEAISNKRQTHNLKPEQTIRLLKTDYLNNIIELPFWIVSQSCERSSLYVSINNKSLCIGTANNIIGTIDASGDSKQQLLEVLRKNKCMIRPKAVTLTLFIRLYLGDLFVHGTGAGNYEYITDHLIRHYYRIPRLDFGVATATMTMHTGANNRNPQITGACLRQKDKISKEVVNYREFFFGLFSKDRLEKLADIKEI